MAPASYSRQQMTRSWLPLTLQMTFPSMPNPLFALDRNPLRIASSKAAPWVSLRPAATESGR